MKKVTSINYDSSTNSCKSWGWVRLTLTMRDTYINPNLNSLTNFTSSNKSTGFKDILPWNILMKTIPISMRIVISYAMNWGIRMLQWKDSNCRTSTSARRKKLI